MLIIHYYALFECVDMQAVKVTISLRNDFRNINIFEMESFTMDYSKCSVFEFMEHCLRLKDFFDIKFVVV